MRRPSHKAMAVAIVACVLLGAGALTFGPLGHRAPTGGTSQFNVTFSETEAQIVTIGPGWIRYGATIPFDFSVDQTNLTWVNVSFSWSDEAGSPLVDPELRLAIQNPNGTVVFNETIPPSQQRTEAFQMNEFPANAVVTAGSSGEAAMKAAGPTTNSTLGDGTWNLTVTVGTIPYARNQVRSGIQFSCDIVVDFFNASVETLTERE